MSLRSRRDKRFFAASLILASCSLLMAHGSWLSPPASAFSGTEGAAFLDIPVGAVPASLGGAYTALATDAYAPVYNPGGLGFVENTQLAGQHLEYLENLRYEHFSLALPLAARGGAGFSIQYLGSGDLDRTDEAGAKVGDFSSYFASYNLSYGHRVSDGMALGLTGKVIHGKLDDTDATAFAADIAGLFRISEQVNLGAAITNLGSDFKFIDQKDPLPLAFKVGVGYQPHRAWTVAVETIYWRTELASFHTGVEWRPLKAVAIRTGYRTDTLRELSALAGLTLGASLRFWGQEFAYAWLPLGDLGNTNYFSLLLRFGQTAEGRKNLRQAKAEPSPLGQLTEPPPSPDTTGYVVP